MTRASAVTARLLVRALVLTAGWGLPLQALSVVAALGLPPLRPLVALAAATWVSYGVHEAGHAWCALLSGTPEGDVHLRRRGPGLVVTLPQLSASSARRVAVAGVAAGATSGVVVTAGALAGMPPHAIHPALVPVAGAVVVVHLVNLLPGTPDGRHVWRRTRRGVTEFRDAGRSPRRR